MKRFAFGVALSVVLASGLSTAAVAGSNITGAGATFPYPLYAKWASAYKKLTGIGLNYQSIGSGGGIRQIYAKTVNFGATDKPLKANVLAKHGLVQFPMVMGGVVPVVNVDGIKSGALKLDGTVLADIYLGKIKRWNDPAIARINNGLRLPDAAITVVHRSDGSGTTFIYTNYLSKVSPEWKTKVGNNASVAWPVGVGGKGNEGVASYVKRIKGSIGYVEYAYALQNKMAYALLKNRSGIYVKPQKETFAAAAAGADWANAPGMYQILTYEPGKKSWPITGATFILMYKVQNDPATAKRVLKFFEWAYANGDGMAGKLDYIPMPDKVVTIVEHNWKAIKGRNGKSVY